MRTGAACFLLLCLAGTVLAWNSKEEEWIGKRRNWWSLQKPQRPAVPTIQDRWIRTPIDAFLLDAMRAKRLQPSPLLDRNRLIRRVTLDLTGLPPTPEEVAAFLADRSGSAYEKLIDRLLAKPQYGERWALKWLDVVRYADTNGYELDAFRPHAWRYRDYVVSSFNAGKPYDQFIREQIAGDEIWPNRDEALIATGFHRAGPIHLVGGNQDEEVNRQEVLTEYASGISSVFLGLTVGCAKCHNHKFDPILQADYYRLQAVFAATQGKDVVLATEQEKKAYEDAVAAYEAKLKPIQEQIKEIEKPYRAQITAEKKSRLDEKFRNALAIPKEQRTAEQQVLADNAAVQTKASWDEVVALLSPADRERRKALRQQMHAVELTQPQPPTTAYAVQDEGAADDIHILKIGDPHQKLDAVLPGFPTVLAPDNGNVTRDACSRRKALAEWIASPDHPLTARVMVNRIWQFRMGKGLVRTMNDFGRLGERPTNPQLLDWLAAEFVARGWSVKAIDRLIVLSSAYQQASQDDAQKAAVDPENMLYWRAHQRRLEGETIRDCTLAVAGQLNPKMGGPPVRVPIEKEVYDLIFSEEEPDNLWPLQPDTTEYNRRSVYLLNKRTVRLPMLVNFDQPDAMTSCPVRPTSTHALQALSLMNSDFMHQQSIAFAQRLQGTCRANRQCQVSTAYSLALARSPRPEEQRMALEFFQSGGPLEDFCLALLNRNEFVYVP